MKRLADAADCWNWKIQENVLAMKQNVIVEKVEKIPIQVQMGFLLMTSSSSFKLTMKL